jgi:hypothetical protein
MISEQFPGEMSSSRPQPLALRVMATVVSYIFHPVFIPVLMTFVLFRLSPVQFAGIQEKNLGLLLIQVALHTAFFPLLTVLLLKGLGFIESIHLNNPKERIIPLMASMIFYFWAYWVFKNINSPFVLRVLLLGSFWGVITVFMISIFFKISMHTAGAGSIVGILAVLLSISPVNMAVPLFIAILLAGLIGTSRMILSAHVSSEIWLGYIVGFLVQVGAYWYLS